MNEARELYLDLLIKSVANLIYGPPPPDPWRDGLLVNATPGRDQHSPAHSMVGILRLRNLRELTQRALDDGIPGDFIETGVWRGGCCILMRGVLAANSVRDRRVYVADSFDGFPPADVARYPMDERKGPPPPRELIAVSEDQVRANFGRYGLLDDQVVFVKGYFSATLPALETGPLALIRLDGDMYESTYVALEHLYPRLSVGGFAIIDDYGALPKARQAVTDYREAKGIAEPMHQADWTAVWWRKSRAAD